MGGHAYFSAAMLMAFILSAFCWIGDATGKQPK
jgi:hypothetical protein